MKRRVILLSLLSLILSAVAYGRAEMPITATSIDRIQLYQTSKSDVITWFGPPSTTYKIGDEELLVYQTPQKDPVMGKETCNLLSVSVDRSGQVTGLVYKKYCER